jgi:iron complex outermembrane receptor protein
MRLPLRATLVALALLSIESFSAHAQVVDRGAQARRDIRGTVTDSASHAPLAGVSVLIAAFNVRVFTDSAGRYRISALLPASVTITARTPGFAPVTRQVDLGITATSSDFVLAHLEIVLDAVSVRTDSAQAFLNSSQIRATMSATEIDQKRGQTVGETIKEMPGVSIIQYGPSIAKPVVRGLHSQRIATINNGVPQEGQQWGGEHAPEIDGFAANEIEVIRGPGTILYGSGAFGGVVRVMPRPLPVHGGLGGQFSSNAFANNHQGAGSLLLEGALTHAPVVGELGWRVQASGRRAGDASTPDYYLPNTGFKEVDYSAAVGVTRAWGRSELDYSHFGTDLAMYVGAHVGNLDDLNRAMQNPFTSLDFASEISRPKQAVRHDLIAWHTDISLPHSAWLETSYGFQHNVRNEFDNHGFAVGSRPAFALELYTHSLDVQYHQAAGGRSTATLGLSASRQGNISPGRSFLIPQYRLYTGAVFGLATVTLARLTLTGGARFDYRWQHAYQYGAPVVVSPDERRAYQGMSGSLGASYKLASAWSVASTVARGWRAPNVSERFSSGVHHGTAQYELGDTSLVPERSLNTDLTVREIGARTRLELSVYSNTINDFIFLKPRDPVLTVRGAYPAYNYAHTDALLRGFELTSQLNPAPWLELYANANAVRGTDQALREPLYDMPADRLTASARIYGHSGAKWIGPFLEIGTTAVRRQDHVPSATVYKLPTAGYGLLNLEIGANAIVLGRLRVEPSLSVRNVFDRRYRDYLSRYRLFVDEPGRDIVFRLTIPFGPTER